MPKHLFIGLLVTVVLAAGLTVAVANAFGPVGIAWMVIPLGLVIALRLWQRSGK